MPDYTKRLDRLEIEMGDSECCCDGGGSVVVIRFVSPGDRIEQPKAPRRPFETCPIHTQVTMKYQVSDGPVMGYEEWMARRRKEAS